MKRVLITGATGFVGANLARRLIGDGHEVNVLVRPQHTRWRIETIKHEIAIHEASLCDKQAVDRVVQRVRPEWVFHLAAYGAYSWQEDMRQMMQTNIIGTNNLVEACLQTGFEAFVNTGSSSEYGFKNVAPMETALLEPNSSYAVTKALATLFCQFTAQNHNVHIPTLRLYSAYGSYEDPNRLMPTLIRHGLKHSLPPLVNPNVAHDYIFIDDVVAAYLLAATCREQEPGTIYNIGSGVQTTLREVVKVAQRVLGLDDSEPQWNSMPNRRWDTTTWVANNRKICTKLGWQPASTLEQGFRQMVAWVRDNPNMYD
jgi:UDP-glucose 4-epimerase